MSKYFIVKDKREAEIMQILLEQRYFVFNDDGIIQYTFKRVPNIQNIYGKTKTILEKI